MTQKLFLQAENPKKTEFNKYSLIVTHDLATSDPFPYDQGFYSLMLFLIAHESSYSQACEVKENHIKKTVLYCALVSLGMHFDANFPSWMEKA